MNKFLVGCLLFGLVSTAGAVTSGTLSDGIVEKDQGYFAGAFFKDTDGQVYKVIRITDDTVYLGYFESGEIARSN